MRVFTKNLRLRFYSREVTLREEVLVFRVVQDGGTQDCFVEVVQVKRRGRTLCEGGRCEGGLQEGC